MWLKKPNRHTYLFKRYFVYLRKHLPMKHPILFILLLFISTSRLSAQYNTPQNNVWVLSNYASIDFSTGVPVTGSSAADAIEGGASVSDSRGNLLFYTDGSTVFNRSNVPMPSGVGIVPFATRSTTQSSLIVPFIGDTSKYYIFSLENQLLTPYRFCHLAYSEVDMTLDGRMGDIIPGRSGIALADEMSEKLIAIAGNDCNVWVIAHKKDSTLFYVYEVTASGVSAPTVYNVGSFPGYGNYSNGVMKCSHDRTKIFVACVPFGSSFVGGGELCDFDPATGAVSNAQVIASDGGIYGAEFSPDNSKLYICRITTPSIIQYDLSLPSLPAIIASGTVLSGTIGFSGDAKLGPDGRIYVIGSHSSTYIGTISSPNLAGLACGFRHDGLALSSGSSPSLGLPNTVWTTPANVPITGPDKICSGATNTYAASAGGGTWTSNNPGVATINPTTGIVAGIAAGIAVITYAQGTTCYVTKQITVNAAPTDITGPSQICIDETATLGNAVSGGHWISGDTSIATIDSFAGAVTGISVGTTMITYSDSDDLCSTYISIEVKDCEVGVSEMSGRENNIRLFPMPAKEYVQINSYTPFAPGSKAEIYDISGNLLISTPLSGKQNTLSITKLASGAYHCIIAGADNSVLHRRLILKQ